MPVTWVEDNSSRSATFYRRGRRATSTYTKSFKVFGYTDDLQLQVDADQKIQQELLFYNYPNTGVFLWAESYSISYLGDDAWQVTINYEKDGADDDVRPQPLSRSRAFDTSGGTAHVTQGETGSVSALGIVTESFGNQERKYPPSAPQLYGAIGVDGDSVAGVDIVIPQLNWTETFDVPNSYVSDNYIKAVAGLTGTVNNASFRTFQADEVLFLGASGAQEWDSDKGYGPWSLSFKFAASPNKTNLTIGTVTGVEKKGHEYLWVRYEDDVQDTTLIKKTKHVYVNAVYKRGDFSGLGIGTDRPPAA
jgi:hypothetical protein